MYYVYILYSLSAGKYYTGQSKYHAKRRREHIREKVCWTRCAGDWQEVFCREMNTREEARALEVKIKNRGAARFLIDIDA